MFVLFTLFVFAVVGLILTLVTLTLALVFFTILALVAAVCALVCAPIFVAAVGGVLLAKLVLRRVRHSPAGPAGAV